jgi:hypothetical protein
MAGRIKRLYIKKNKTNHNGKYGNDIVPAC